MINDEKINLKDYFSNSIVTPEVKQELIGYINEAFNRIIATFQLIPDGNEGKILEIGANPYFLTLLIKKYRNYEISLINYFGENDNTDATQTIDNEKYGEKHTFIFKNINIEKEILPYPEKYFDVVIYGEVIEHLIENPIFSLYNIHRILKDDGVLIVSTPNVYRYQNVIKFFCYHKFSIYDPYSNYGVYGRHNREYTMYELQDILEKTGFSVISKKTLYAKDKRGFFKIFSKILEIFQLGDYLLFKVIKKPEFSWYLPEYLYRGNPTLVITDEFILMGKNCCVHIDSGWHCIETWSKKGNIRWTKKNAKCHIKPKKIDNLLIIDFYSAFDNFEFSVLISQNNKVIFEFKHNADFGWGKIIHRLPVVSCDPLSIEFIITESWIPQQKGLNEDVRELGIAIQGLGLV